MNTKPKTFLSNANGKHLLKAIEILLLIEFIVAFLFPIQSGESIFDQTRLWCLLCTYNTIEEPDQRQLQYLLSIPNYFGIYFWMICKDFYNFNCFIINHDFLVITFWMHYTIFIFISGKIRLMAIVNRIFHVSDFLRLFMISLKYGLIL